MDKLDEFYCALTRVHYLILRFREIPNSLREIDLPKQLSETDWRVLLETTMLRLLEHEEASLTEASRAFFKAYNRVKLYVKEGEVIKYIEEFHVRRSEFEDLLAETYKNSDQLKNIELNTQLDSKIKEIYKSIEKVRNSILTQI